MFTVKIIFKISSPIVFEKTGKLAIRYDKEVMSFLLHTISCKMSLLRHWQPDRSWANFLPLLSDMTYSPRFSVILSD